jgi:hypothetical protein
MTFRILSIAIPFIWFGLLGGISFLEAPLKFQAPGITLGLGLGIGRLVFGVMNKIEIAFALLLLVSIIIAKPTGKFVKIAIATVLILLLLETVWLLPLLDIRAQAVIDGTGTPFSNMHLVYIAFDVVKFLLLFALGVNLTKQNLKFAV